VVQRRAQRYTRAGKQLGAVERPIAGAVATRQTQPGYVVGQATTNYFVPRTISTMGQVDRSRLWLYAGSPERMLQILAAIMPEVSQAIWNVLRSVQRGMRVLVRDDAGNSDQQGQAIADEIIARVNPYGGGIQAVVGGIFRSIYTQGAACVELVPTENLRDVADIVAVNPSSIYFRTAADGSLAMHQFQIAPKTTDQATPFANYVPLNRNLVWYVPFDAATDDPYGQPPILPIINEALDNIGFLDDLRRFAHVGAWGHLDVSVKSDALIQAAPAKVKADPTGRLMHDYLQAFVDEAKSLFDQLKPDEVPVHTDNVTVSNIPGGAGVQLEPIIRLYERRGDMAVKMPPFLMGHSEAATETMAKEQHRVFASGMETVQQVGAGVLAAMLTTGLRLRGHLTHVEVTFEAVKTTDRLIDAQSQQLEIGNVVAMRDQGWIDQDEASYRMTGSGPVAAAPTPTPPARPTATLGDATRQLETRALHASKPQTAHALEDHLTQALAHYFRFLASRQALASKRAIDQQGATQGDQQAAAALLTSLLLDYIPASYDDFGRQAAQGVGGAWDAASWDAESYANERAQLINNATWRMAEAEQEQGISLREVLLAMATVRAAVIAQNEAANLHQVATAAAYQQNGVSLVRWQTTSGNPCPTCLANAADKPRKLGEAFSSGHSSPLAHVNCQCELEPVEEAK